MGSGHHVLLKNPMSSGGVREAAPGRRRRALGPVVKVPVRSLVIEQTLRVSGEQPEHTRALAAVLAQLPPIVVHRPTMRVIDGLHRVRAAELCGREFIAAYMFDGDEVDALALATQMNLESVLPLSSTDRRVVAKRIITMRPQWSDRLVASITKLSTKTVREVRRSCQVNSQLLTEERVGRDGRVRPVNAAAKREMAADLFRKNPEMSLRQVAKAVGMSPETARSVRNRLRLGGESTEVGPSGSMPPPGRAAGADRRAVPTVTPGKSRLTARQRAALVGRLMEDPSLRYNEHGRMMLHLLKAYAMTDEEWVTVLNGLPAHRREVLADMALECARRWTMAALHLIADTPR